MIYHRAVGSDKHRFERSQGECTGLSADPEHARFGAPRASAVPSAVRGSLGSWWALLLALLALASAFASTPVQACSCRVPSLREALLRADVVAEVRLLEVGPADPEDDFEVQALRVRLERVFKGPPSLSDGEERWVGHPRCNSHPARRRSVGRRWVQFFSVRYGRLVAGHCSRRLSAWAPLPRALLELRERRRGSPR
jgi:hypothetical protein